MQLYHNGTTYLNNQDINISFTMPYNLGAQGVIIWGSSPNNFPGGASALWNYVNTTTGPMVNETEYQINQCSIKYCNGHGKCIQLNSNTCNCDIGYQPPNCT